MMRPYVNLASTLCVYFLSFFHFESALAQTAPDKGYEPPLYRNVLDLPPPQLPAATEVRLLADDDVAPYSFLSSSGAPGVLSVELAMAACAELGIRCTVSALPFAEILPALARGEGDVAISGPRLDEASVREALATRPYFRTMGRFAVQTANPVTDAGVAALAGKRIAVTAKTLHARWLETYYTGSEIVPFEDAATAADALRTGKADILFGDNVQLIYWTSGQASGGCCRLLGGAYSDAGHFSRNFVFMVQKQKPELRAAFDYGLDMAQKNGATARILKAYFPLSPW